MRVTQHNGRTRANGTVLGTKHNDRSFDTSKADNIKPDGQVLTLAWSENGYQSGIPFEQAEAAFYEHYLTEDLNAQNDRAIRAGHRERIQTMEQYRASRKHCPEEVILQVGNAEKTIDPKTLAHCVNEYIREMMQAGDGLIQMVDTALHLDETTPHAHIRRVWLYHDDEQGGMLRTGQEKALQELGYAPTCTRDGAKEGTKYNNRKITFDAEMREKWLDICERHGIEVEREPAPDGKHNRPKEEFIKDKLSEAAHVLDLADHAREILTRARDRGLFRSLPRNVAQEISEVVNALDSIGMEVDKLHDIRIDDLER